MWERTVTIGSAGKAFSSTGAKVRTILKFKMPEIDSSYFTNF